MSRCFLALIVILTLIQTKQRDMKLYPALVQNEVHDEFCQNIRSERRQKNETGYGLMCRCFKLSGSE